MEFSNKEWILVSYISHKRIINKLVSNINNSVILAAVLMFLGLGITIVIIRLFFLRFNNTVVRIEKTAAGQTDFFDEKYFEQDLVRITKALNNIIVRRKEIFEVLQAIAEGDYTKKIKIRSSNDEIAVTLNVVILKLQEIEIKNKKQQEEHEIRNWQRKGQIAAADIQRTSNNETEELSFNIIRSIVRYTDAQLGAIYVKREDDSKQEYMVMSGSYAFEEKRNIKVKFGFGQGVVGTCAQEEKKILMENIPDNYLTIGSGLGSSKPGFIAVFPVFSQEKIVAVFEIGFIKRPEEYKLSFIEQLSNSIGAWLSATENLKESENLLRLSQEKTLELSEAEAELNSFLRAVNNAVYTIQYDPDGSFINANDLYLSRIGYERKELEGTNVLDMVKDKKDELKEIIDKVMQGQLIEQEVVRYTKSGQSIEMRASYSPFYNSDGEITSIIFFGFEENQNIKSKKD